MAGFAPEAGIGAVKLILPFLYRKMALKWVSRPADNNQAPLKMISLGTKKYLLWGLMRSG